MKLFFETAKQASVFLAALPIGFLLGFLLDIGLIFGKARPAADIVALLVAGAGLVILSLLSMENGLQLYHLLAVVMGALLYTCGLGRLLHFSGRWLRKRFFSGRKKQ